MKVITSQTLIYRCRDAGAEVNIITAARSESEPQRPPFLFPHIRFHSLPHVPSGVLKKYIYMIIT